MTDYHGINPGKSCLPYSPMTPGFGLPTRGPEIDLLLRKNGRMVGVECKRTDAPRMTPSIRTAPTDLNLDKVIVIYPGDKRFVLAEQVEALPLKDLARSDFGSLIKSVAELI